MEPFFILKQKAQQPPNIFQEFGLDKPLSFSDEGSYSNPILGGDIVKSKTQASKKKDEGSKKQGWTQ